MASVGQYLTYSRRKRRVTLETAAEATRIRPEYLMRMESDDFGFLAPAYVRGFLRSYAGFLRVDPGPLLEEFERHYGRRIDTRRIVALGHPTRMNTVPGQKRPKWAIVGVAAAAAFVMLGLLGVVVDDTRPEVSRSSTAQSSSAEPMEATPTPSALGTPAQRTALLRDGIKLMVQSTTAKSWVTVESDGVTVYNQMLVPGEVETFRAEMEMRVVLGYAAGVELALNQRKLGSPGIPGVFTFELPGDEELLRKMRSRR